jgi:hypothetical protein
MGTLSSLPMELLLLIIQHAGGENNSYQIVVAWSQTCRGLRSFVLHLLYQRITLRRQASYNAWEATIMKYPSLAKMATALIIDVHAYCQWRYRPYKMDILQHFDYLQTLTLSRDCLQAGLTVLPLKTDLFPSLQRG